MYCAKIVQTNNTRQAAWTFNCHSVIKHLDLNVSSLDTVISVCDGIYDDFFPGELRVFRSSHKPTVISELCTLLDLTTHKIQCLTDNIKNMTIEYFVLDDIHFCADFGFDTIIADKTHSCSWEEALRILSEKKQSSTTHFFSAIVLNNVIVVLTDVFFRRFTIADFLAVFRNKIHINIFDGGTEHRLIFVISGAFGIHKL